MQKLVSHFVHALVILVLLTSCATESLWRKPTYTERFHQFYMTEGNEKIVIIGQKYHYIFPLDTKLKNIIAASYRNNIKLGLYRFTVKKDNVISGSYRLSISADTVTPAQLSWLKSNGFKQFPKSRTKDLLHYSGQLQGTRYLANGALSTSKWTSNKFSKEYELLIEEEPSALAKNSKIMVTPITVAADGALFIGTVGLLTAAFLVGCTVGGGSAAGNEMCK